MKAKRSAKKLSQQARWNAAHPEVIKAATARLKARNLNVVAKELERRGGHCVYPGCSTKRVDWHHRQPAPDDVRIGNSIGLHSEARLRQELAKCDPLRRKHHMIIDGRTKRASNYWRINKYVQTKPRPFAKLTEDDVREIRRRYANGERIYLIARDFPTTASNINMIVHRRKWAWLSD